MTSVFGSEVECQWICAQLIPYFTTVALYFTLLIPYEEPSCWAVMVKCAPIISLMYFVVKVGYKNGYNNYSTKILSGLIFCCTGDGFLLWNRTFVHGMLAFLVGHINYVWAFGFMPLRLNMGIIIFSVGGIALSFLYSGLSGVLVIGIPIYILVLNTMVWRATAQIQEPWSWIQLCTCIGSILFAISDLMIGIDRFARPIAHSQIFIMATYYIAQLGVSLSVARSR